MSFVIIGIALITVGIAQMVTSLITYLWTIGVPWSQYKGHAVSLVAGIVAHGAPMLILGALMLWLRESLSALTVKITNKDSAEPAA